MSPKNELYAVTHPDIAMTAPFVGGVEVLIAACSAARLLMEPYADKAGRELVPLPGVYFPRVLLSVGYRHAPPLSRVWGLHLFMGGILLSSASRAPGGCFSATAGYRLAGELMKGVWRGNSGAGKDETLQSECGIRNAL